MKKHSILFLLLIICGCFLIPSKSFAFQHGYESHSDFIYALARNELPVYISDYSEDLKTMLPKYSGVKVVGSSGSWYEIQYTSKKGTSNYGWITREEFQSNCLIYDGREKRPFANGTYHLSFYQNQNSSTFLRIAIMHIPIHLLIPLSMSEIIATLSKKQMKINI